jgi:hypothetical protein
MMWGLGAASIPIILHLLNRRRFREEPWAAMRFLLAAIRKNQRRIRIEQLILLAVRTLLIILIVAAMAKPYLESLGALPVFAGLRTHRVIVLDGSLSMAYSSAETTRFDQAKKLASRLVKAARRGDVISVVLMADPPRAIIKDPSPNLDEVRKEIESITLPHGGTNLAGTFRMINDVLGTSSISQKEVVFLSDLQSASWRRYGSKPDEDLKRELANLEARKPRGVVIDLGDPKGQNRAVVDLRLSSPIVTPGMQPQPTITAVVREFGREIPGFSRIRLMIDGQVGPESMLDNQPGKEKTAVFFVDFASPGDHVVEAVIDDDPLKLDNHRWLAVPVREFLNVLLVDGDPKTEPFRSETDFLAVALSPEADTSGVPSNIKTEVVPEAQLAHRDLTPYDVVVLCNIPQVSEREVSALEAFLQQGGGVVVFGGDQVQAENYNRLLFASGKGLLPAEIGPTVGRAGPGEEPFGLLPLGYRHPIIQEFGGEDEPVRAGLTQVKTMRFHKLLVPKNSAAQVALAFDNNDPAVVEAPRNRGRVIQVATSADRDWTTWPLHQSYPPVMEKVIFQAASGRLAERNVRVGQPLDQALPPAASSATASVRRPDGRTEPAKIQAKGDVSQLSFDKTDLSGIYQVKVGPPVSADATYSANPDPNESDPAKLDRVALADALPGWSFAYFDDPKALLNNAAAVSLRGELHRPLLWTVIGLILLETVLAWWFGHHR